MRKIELDIRSISTVKALHIYLQYMLDLPAYYGRNLDALHDALTQESEARQMIIRCEPSNSEEMRAYLPRLMRVLEDAGQENERLSILVI